MYKDNIKKELEKLSKEDLINIITELVNVYVSSIIYKKALSEVNLQKCICDVKTNIQEMGNDLLQQLNAKMIR